MKFYTKLHTHCCGVDLHAKTLFICMLDNNGQILMYKNVTAKPEPFIRVISPYREDLVVGVECMFSWYWLANLCLQERKQLTRF